MGFKRKTTGLKRTTNTNNQGELFHNFSPRALNALISKHHVGPNFPIPESLLQAQKMHSGLLSRLTSEEHSTPLYGQATFERNAEISALNRELSFIEELFPVLKRR